MVDDKYITQAQMDTMKFPKLLTDSDGERLDGRRLGQRGLSSDPWAPYIMDVVYNELTATGPGADNVPQQQLETGGLKIVTTISRSMEKEMYKAVDANIAAIKATPGATVPARTSGSAPSCRTRTTARSSPCTRAPGRTMSAKQCAELDCDLNTAVYAREQVGSSFKPYVLSAAVADGMNVKTSTLNASPYLCVPPDCVDQTVR